MKLNSMMVSKIKKLAQTKLNRTPEVIVRKMRHTLPKAPLREQIETIKRFLIEERIV